MFLQKNENLYFEIDKINIFFENKYFQIQKIYATCHFIILSIYGNKKNNLIYIGRGHKYQGIWTSFNLVKPCLRVTDRDKEFFNSTLKNKKINRIFYLKNYKGFVFENMYTAFSFFYQDNKLCFSLFENDKTGILLSSVSHGIKQKYINEDLELYLSSFYKKTLKDSKSENLNIDSYINRDITNYDRKEIKRFEIKKEKRLKNIKKDLDNIDKIISLQGLLLNNEIKLDKKIISINKTNLKLPTNNEWKNRDYLFQKIKKLKSVKILMMERYNIAENKKFSNENSETNKQSILMQWKSLKISKYFTCKYLNHKIYLGKTWQENIKLSKMVNSKTTYWFHLHDMTSAHIYVEPFGDEFDSEIYNIIGSLLLRFNKNKNCEKIIKVKLSDVSFINKGKGLAKYKKQEIIKFKYIDKCMEIITLL